ncbi:hypothetical protein IT402_00790 [Candidatus Nomurabacteria bacterium]|nr:hypothetical protein [Candidatus Nomurabacteria bacterium]
MSIENNMMPERGSGEDKEMFDAKGNKRFNEVLGDGEVFFGSKEEIAERIKEKREELHNK